MNTLAAEKNTISSTSFFKKNLTIISKLRGICVPLGDFNEIHSHLFYFNIEHNMRLTLRVKTCQSQKNTTVEATRVQTAIRRKHQFLPSNAQIWHVVFSTRGRNKKTLPTYETVTGMVERLNFAFLVFVSFSCVFEMSRCVTHRYDRNGKHFVDPVPNVYAGTCKSRIA